MSGRCAALTLALAALLAPHDAPAQAPRYAFAVVANLPASVHDEAAAQKLIDAIGRDPRDAFVVYDGNLKGAHETCADALYDARHALLDASRPPLVFVPGQHDWASCGGSGTGAYDPVERLDQLRQTFFADANSLGQNPLTLTRESEVSRFLPYRENVRWQLDDTVFVALNVPDGNNHYLNAGGRNGEFEDRVIANGFWLEHAAEYARRRHARAIVIFIQGNPLPERYERSGSFAWLRFGRRAPRDGYVEFRRSLVKLAETFAGPVVLIHADDARLARGFVIDQPLRNDKGARIPNVTRIAFALHDPLRQWLQVDADTTRKPPLHVSVRDVPKHLPPLPPALQTPQTGDGQSAGMPEISSMPDVTEIPPGAGSAPDGTTWPGNGSNSGGWQGGTGGASEGSGMPRNAPAWPAQGTLPGARAATPPDRPAETRAGMAPHPLPGVPASAGTAPGSVQRGF